MKNTPDTLLRRAVHHYLPSTCAVHDAQVRLTPSGIDWRPKGLRMVRACLSHDPAGDAPHGSPWRLSLVWRLPFMMGRDDRLRMRDYGWNDAPDAADIAALIREVL